MSRTDAENVIKHVIAEIMKECEERGRAVTDAVVTFTVKAVVLDPRNEFNVVDRNLSKKDVNKLQEMCVNKLMQKCSPSLDTINMQVYFHMNYTSRREFLEEIQQVVLSRLSSVSRDITDSGVNTGEDLDGLYHRIISYTLLCSGMGSPTHVHTVQEAAAALHSVFPPAELGSFMVLLKKEKEQQLSELTMIVTGIRLFNKAQQMDLHHLSTVSQQMDLHHLMPDLLSEALPVVSRSIEEKLSVSQALSWKYTSVLEKLTDPDREPGEHDVPMVLLREALYNVRQHQAFLRTLLADSGVCSKHVELLQTELWTHMKLLTERVKSKSAVPTAQVFPLFKALSKVWTGLQDEAELLNILRNISHHLQSFLASHLEIFSEAYLDELLEATDVKTDEQRMKESSDDRVVPAEMKTQEWLLPETTDGFNDLLLQYDGVCAYTLVNRDGLLLPGYPHIGVLKHKDKHYVFSSKEAALNFASRPDDFIAEVAERAKFSPELTQLLKLHQQFSPYTELESGERSLVKSITKCEISTQTDIHPVQRNMVQSYEWNEWELRRKAIKLADLRTTVTHSAQTDLSHMRRDNVSQTWPPKDAACQSKREAASNVAKPQVYLEGLRGRRNGPVVKINLTRSVHD